MAPFLVIAALVALLIPAAWFAYRMATRPARLASLRRQLLAVAEEVPPGMFRIYSSPSGTEEIVVLPSLGRLHPDRFEVIPHDAVRDLYAAGEGTGVPFVCTTYAVHSTPPAVWRLASADLVRDAGGENGPTVVQQEKPSLAASWRLLRLDARTGVITPTREELQELVESIRGAKSCRDVARTQAGR